MAGTAGPATFPGGVPQANPAYLVDQYGNPLTTQMAIANGASYNNIWEFVPGIDNGSTIDKLVGLNGVGTFQDWIRYMTLMGKVYSVSTGKIASSAVGTVGWQLLNNSTIKNAFLISLLLIFNSSNQHLVNLTTANANTITGWAGNDNVVVPVNNKAGGVASLMTSSYTNANITGALIGSTREVTGTQNNAPIEILTNGECILLPAGAANGVAIFVTSGVANPWSVTATYIEY